MLQHNEQLIKAIAVTAELTGTDLSKDAARVMYEDLSSYHLAGVLRALVRCRKELKGKLTLSDVLSRIDDGRPGIEEAWAMIPQYEEATVVWTEEMAKAFGIASPLLNEGDTIAARMAFKESYTKFVQQARNDGSPVKWCVSLGHDKAGREGPIKAAVEAGRLSYDYAATLIPGLPAPNQPMLENKEGQKRIAELIKPIIGNPPA